MSAPPLPTIVQAAHLPHPCLEYAAAGIDYPKRRWIDLVALLLGIPSCIAPFVPFAYGDSPLRILIRVWQEWYGFGPDWLRLLQACSELPFFLGPLIIAGKLRLLIHPALRPSERCVLWAAVVASSSCTGTIVTFVLILILNHGTAEIHKVPCVLLGAILSAGIPLLVGLRRRIARDRLAQMAVELVYLAAIVPSLYGVAEHGERGWWLTLVAAVVFTADFGMTLIPPRPAWRQTMTHSLSQGLLLDVAALVVLLGGCVAQEPPRYGPITPEATSARLPFLRDGITSKAECIARLGDPSFVYDNGATIVYVSQTNCYEGVPLPLTQTPWSSASLVLGFDEQGVLRQHAIIERTHD
jgi:hypothetical protein